MTRKIGLTYTWTFTVHDAAGALSNADALPVAAVYEDDTDASVDTPTVEQIGVLTGHYRVITYLDPLIYTADHSYNVMVTMAVGGVSMGARVESFVAEAANQTDILARLADLIATPSGPITYENPWFVGNLPAGGTVTIKVYDSLGVEETLDDSDCDEFAPGYYRWSTVNMTTYPGTVGSYFWVMVDSVSGRTTWGVGPIGTPEDIGEVTAGAVWDALEADHDVALSFARRLKAVPTATENRQEMDLNSVQLGEIRTNTDRIDGLIEDDGLGNDRFTEKALEEAPGMAPADIAAAVWGAARADYSGGGSFGEYAPSNLLLIRGDATAAGFLKKQYDGTGAVDPTFPATQAQADALLTAVGTPVALDGGSADIAGMLTKIADDNNGADFDAATDSLHEIAIAGGGGPTKEEIRIEMDTNSTKLASIEEDTEAILEAMGEMPKNPEEWNP